MSKKWAVYCRVSTSDQQSGLDSQIRAMREFCERQGVKEFELFTDEGISGAKESRPSLNRLMAAVEAKEISHVAVYSFSRFARSTTHLLKALENFQKLGVEFISYTEQIQTNSPMGRAFFTVIAAIAQLERELIVERVKNGLKAAKARGKHIGRKKMRDSDLIRKLLKAKVTYRRIAEIAKCSHGAVHAEKVAMKKEIAEQEKLGIKSETEMFFPPAPSVEAVVAEIPKEQAA
jgi:DNA invertase Pin-like site-specific DNA recombinase